MNILSAIAAEAINIKKNHIGQFELFSPGAKKNLNEEVWLYRVRRHKW